MHIIRPFIAGLILPAALLPLFLIIVLWLGHAQVVGFLSIHLIPWVWGIWNVLYWLFCRDCLPGHHTVRLFVTGGILGLLLSLWGVFFLHVPEILGMSGGWEYSPIVFLPIIYAILWRFVVGPLNTLLGLEEG